ncbi:Hypothetical protein SMAX5B_020660 [Scophthalmus maximus]|uniref:Uncharacterized protein n=1 Tax=Scophthalmus maximus TaxID=52904 RepID=A0A2U9AZK3_SCOMX|nr:Hypothetical protein SMAX5B_020660 [Scophthalmus maximus]
MGEDAHRRPPWPVTTTCPYEHRILIIRENEPVSVSDYIFTGPHFFIVLLPVNLPSLTVSEKENKKPRI